MTTVFSKKSAARALGISVETLHRYKKMRKIPFRQIGDRVVFTESDLNAFLEACAVPATALPTDAERRGMAKRAGGEGSR